MKKEVKKTKAQIALEKKNKAFKKLGKLEKRVEIAKDVIAQVKANKYKGRCGEYINAEDLDNYLNGEYVSLQPILLEKDYTCEVCAKGGLFLSTVRKRNKFEVSDLYDLPNNSYQIVSELEDIFTENQLDLIECAFEGRLVMGSCNDNITLSDISDEPTKLAEKAFEFYHKYTNDNDRLIAIMQNIIDNKGVFKP